MSARFFGILLAGLFLVPSFASGAQWQHDAPEANTICSTCHSLFVRTPANSSVYDGACLTCHNASGHYGTWQTTDQAVPGTRGRQHNWSNSATSATYGANIKYLPDSARAMLVDGTKLQCTVCHNPHVSEGTPAPESMHTSIPVGVATDSMGTTGPTQGTATLTLTATQGAPAMGFRIMVRSVDASGGTFILSHTPGGREGTWMNWVSNAWTYVGLSGPGRPYQNGVAVGTDTAGVSIAISANAQVGDYWDFYVGYPFLRITNVKDGACYNCHKERVMNHTRARGADVSYLPNGVRTFSHPVNVPLNVTATYNDRTTILDGDGTSGSSITDGVGGVPNPSNDLLLKGGVVGCTTCHSAHNADSNSLTVDVQ